MIKIMLQKSGKTFIVTIQGKKVLYWDSLQGKIWGGPLQYLPPDASIQKKIRESRNKIPAQFIDLFKIPEEELKEFEEAKTEEDLKALVLKDAKRNLCKVIDMRVE